MKRMKNPFNADAGCASSYFFNSILRPMRPMRAAVLAAMALAASGAVQAQTPFLSELRAFAFGFCPKGWTLANGSTLAINTNQAAFALMGNIYGGNGTTTFNLPDLRGRMPLGQGTGPQGNTYAPGQWGGQESTTITAAQMPTHTHALTATAAPATHATPTAGAMLAQTQNAGLYTTVAADTTLDMRSPGNGQAVYTRDPSLAITWCVAMSGVFPSAN